jgi:lysophospholipase L1-like esterase
VIGRKKRGDPKRYRASNAALGPPAPGEQRVVFFGDSITECWDLERWFPGKRYVNRGIGGESTQDMLLRFDTDVIALAPAIVLILAGTNDIAGHAGWIPLAKIEANCAHMAERAEKNGIRTVLSSVLPAHFYTRAAWKNFLARPRRTIHNLNAGIREYCAAHALVYLDYYSSMVDQRGYLRKELASDGVHPNEAGYSVMAPLAQKAIEQAAKQGIRVERPLTHTYE